MIRIIMIVLVSALAVLDGYGVANDTLRSHYSKKISEDSLRQYLTVIASDEFEGRDSGKPGQKKAARYIADHFERFGLEQVADSGYYQRFYLIESAIEKAEFSVNNRSLEYIDDFYFFGAMVSDGIRAFSALQFLGYGIDDTLYSDYVKADTLVKNVVIWQGEPRDGEGNYLISGDKRSSDWGSDFSTKVNAARNNGVENLFIVNEDYDMTVARLSFYLTVPRVGLWNENRTAPVMAVYFISPSTAKRMLGRQYDSNKLKQEIEKERKGRAFTVSGKYKIDINKSEKKLSTENVMGLIRGSSKADEYLIMTAHYDHLGMVDGEIYNGADDDGSGTAALIEMARVLAEAKATGNGPERSVLFLAVSAEEKGLIGSAYYTENPVFPLESTVANLNIDMIGRSDANHEENSEYIYLIGSNRLSTTLHEISEQVNRECCNILLDYTYNDPRDPNRFYYRSDHYNFIKNGIPAIFYFSGVHEDYHQPGDTVDKIQFEKMTSVVRFIFSTAWEVANTDRSIEVNVFEQ